MNNTTNITLAQISDDRKSDELEEVIGDPPRKIVTWGTTGLAIILLLLLVVSYFVSYSDKLVSSFKLATNNTPKTILSKINGKIDRLFVSDKNFVNKGQVLAIVESIASYDEVKLLYEELKLLKVKIEYDNITELIKAQPKSYNKLGELQNDYQTFTSQYISLQVYLENHTLGLKKKIIQNEYENLSELNKKLEAQIDIYTKDYIIAQQDFKAKETLFNQKVIPLLELKQEESKLLNKSLPIENIKTSILTNKSLMSTKLKESIQLTQQFEDQKLTFIQSLNTMISKIEDWENRFLLVSPISGYVSWQTPVEEKQDIKQNQEIFYITPVSSMIYGELSMNQNGFGKLQIGQKVLVSLNGFPFEEYGKLKGTVSFISSIPNDNTEYKVRVALDSSLVTDRGYKIDYRNGMTGTAEVITRKTRLIRKLFHGISRIFDSPNR